MLDSANQLKDANSPGIVTYSDCHDDKGVFHFDHDKSHNSEIHKGQDIDIHLRGTVDSQIIANNIHIQVSWNGAVLYKEDHDEERIFDHDVEVDFGWYLPAITPAGKYKCTITG